MLAPDAQEKILSMESVEGAEPQSERMLRPVSRAVSWLNQRVALEAILP
jgi:hypothetical protein